MDIALANIDHHNLIEVADIEGYVEANDMVINEGDEGNEEHNGMIINGLSKQIINWNDRNSRLKVWSIIYFVIFVSDMILVSNQYSPSSSDKDTLTNIILLLTADVCLAFSIIFVIEINRYICFIVGTTQLIGAVLYIVLAVLTTKQFCHTTVLVQDYYSNTSSEISNPHIHQCRLNNIAPKLCVALFSIYYALDILFITACNTANMRIKCTSFILTVFGSLRAVNVLLDIKLSWSIAQLYPPYTIGVGYAVLAAVCLLLFIYTNYHKKFNVSLGYAQLHCLLLLLSIGSILTWAWYKTDDDTGTNGNSVPTRSIIIFIPAALFLLFDVYCGSRQDEHRNEINWNISYHRLTIWSIIYFIISIADIIIFVTLDLETKEFIKDVSDIYSVDDAYTYFTLLIAQNGTIICVTFYILLVNSKHYFSKAAAVLFVIANVLKIGCAVFGMRIWCIDIVEQNIDTNDSYDTYSENDQNSFSSDECRMPFIGTVLFSSLFGIYLGFDIIYQTGNNNLVRIGVLSLTLCVFAFVNGIHTAYYDNNVYYDAGSGYHQLYNIITAGYLLMGTGCILISIYVGCKMKSIQLISSKNKNLFHKFIGLLLLVSAAFVYTIPWISNMSQFPRAPSVFFVSIHSVIMCVPAVLILVYDIQYV